MRRSRLVEVALGSLIAILIAGVAVGVGGTGSSPGYSRARVTAAVRRAGAGATSNAASAGVTYGLAEPAGALPGAEDPADVAAWLRIRSDVVASGGCWLRSDLDSWLTGAIDAFSWLGSASACSTSPGSPVKVLAILDDQTVWSARNLCPDASFSAGYLARRSRFTLDDWRVMVRCLARRYAGRISAYEVWNEPLLAKSAFGYQDGSAAHYFDLLRVADTEIKAADPAATVIALGGSDIYAGGDEARLATMRSFSADLVALGAARYADAISLHAYPWGRHDPSVWASFEDQLRFQQQAWERPVWITETGQRASDGWTQSAYLYAAYSLFVRAGVRHIFWFSITDQPDGDFGMRGRPVESAMHAFALANP